LPVVRGLSTTVGSTPFRLALQPLRPDALDTKKFFVDESMGGTRISPWHHIPLISEGKDSVVNMVCGMPRNSTAQFNISTVAPYNPLEQRTSGTPGTPFFSQLNSPCDMGEAPQTWQTPEAVDPFTGSPGCGAPLGLVDLTPNLAPSSLGSVYALRVIGALPLVINGVTTWKVSVWATQDVRVGVYFLLLGNREAKSRNYPLNFFPKAPTTPTSIPFIHFPPFPPPSLLPPPPPPLLFFYL
jgi:inorganic pyrophosphatase